MLSPAPFRLAFLSLTLLALSGCGAGIVPAIQDGTIPILPSTEIATGAWTIWGDTSTPGSYGIYPIGGFLGAIAADGTSVAAGLTIASTDVPGSYIPAACLGYTIALSASGTASNGILTLDSDFANSHLHLVAQLSADRKSILSGSYNITGACTTNSPHLEGYWNAPLTGTYKGQLNTLSGATAQVTANLTQAPYYRGDGYIAVDGTILFTIAGCTTTLQLNGAYLDGYLNSLFGYTSSTTSINGLPTNNAFFVGAEDPLSQTISQMFWSYPDSGCGAATGDPNNPGQLVRQ